MKGNWKEKRKLELIRHINGFLVGLMLIYNIGLVGSWDLRDMRPGEVETFIISTIYIICYCLMMSRFRFEGE